MRKFKKIFSVILSTAMIFTGALPAFIPADTVRADIISPEDKGYAEGRVIVCVQETDKPDIDADGETPGHTMLSLPSSENDKTGESLLAGAVELMDVSDACNKMAAAQEIGLTEDKVSSDRQSSADINGGIKTSLKVIESDEYSTQELIDRLSALPQVVFAEPDYLIHTCSPGDPDGEYILSGSDSRDGEDAISYSDIPQEGATSRPDVPDGEYILSGSDSRDGEDAIFYSDVPQEVITSRSEVPQEDTPSYQDVPDGEDILSGPDDRISGTPFYAADAQEGTPDLTDHQYSFGNTPGGIEVPGWNDPDNKNAAGTVVAVIDSGVDYNHQDFKDIMWDEGLEYNVLKEMGGGKYGYCNCTDPGYHSDDPKDDLGHGTLCAGVVAAGWNGLGISGAANGTRIMAVKVSNYRGYSYFSYILDGLNYILQAKKAGVNVAAINCSMGFANIFPSLEIAIRELSDNGVVSVFASGNESINSDYFMNTTNVLSYTPGGLTVNSCDRLNLKSGFSNTGMRTTDLFAPGTAVLSTYINGKYPPAFLYRPSRDQKGVLMSNDYETMEGGYFETAAAGEDLDVSLSIETDPEAVENHELKASFDISGKETYEECSLISFTPRDTVPEIAGQTDTVRFVMKCRTDAEELMLGISVKTTWGTFSMPSMAYCEKSMERISFKLPKSMDMKSPQIRLYVRRTNITGPDRKISVWLDDCFLSTDTVEVPYMVESGTSFAAPAVAGEAAILACAFPNDSAEKRAARIMGSVRRYDQYKGLCVSGGLANVRNALNGDYMPVVNDISSTPDGQLAISGYFFGSMAASRVKLTQYGTDHDCEITKLYHEPDDPDAGILYVKTPEGIKSGEVLITVTDTARNPERQTGVRYRSISLPDHSGVFYERLPQWTDAGYMDLTISNIVGLNDTLYMSAYDPERAYTAKTRLFTLKGTDYSSIQDGPGCTWLMRRCCVYDRKLWYIEPWKMMLIVYDPESGKKEEYSLTEFSDMPEGDDIDLVNYDIYNKGDGILIFFTSEYGVREVWRLDPFTKKADKLLDLKAFYGSWNIYGLNVTEQGTEIYTGFGKPIEDDSKTVMEKIIINPATGKATSELLGYDILPEGYTLSNERVVGYDTRQGIYLAGGYKLMDGTDQIEADNWFFDYAHPEKGFVPCEKKISSERLYEPAVCCYRGKVYFSGKTTGNENMRILAYGDACGETWDLGDKPVVPDPQPEKKITSLVRTGKQSLKLDRGESAVLSCRASYPASMKEEDRPPLLYRSENEELVRVNPFTGALIAARPGNTNVVASCGNKKVVFNITISRKASPSSLETNLTMKKAEQYRLSFDPGYGTGREKVVWTSLDNKTASVKNGLVTAKKAGTTVIRVTVKDGNKVINTQDCNLTVEDISVPKAQSKDRKSNLSLNKGSINVKTGETINLTASISGTDRDKVTPVSLVTNENLIEKSEENDSQTGQVLKNRLNYNYSFTALAPGTAYISVTSTNPETGAQNIKLCKVTISAPAQSISLTPDDGGHTDDDGTWVLSKGADGHLKAVITPENCTDTGITWTAKGGSVKVSNGVVSARKISRKDKKTGQYIPDTVTVKCGKITKSIKVIVTD